MPKSGTSHLPIIPKALTIAFANWKSNNLNNKKQGMWKNRLWLVIEFGKLQVEIMLSRLESTLAIFIIENVNWKVFSWLHMKFKHPSKIKGKNKIC
jgi:hypothetical protein